MPKTDRLRACWAYTDTARCDLTGYAIADPDKEGGRREWFGVALEVCGTASAVGDLFRRARRGDVVSLVVRDGAVPSGCIRHIWTAPRGGARYAALTVPLSNGAVHGLVLHPQATAGGVRPEEPFFVVAPADAPESQVIHRFADGLTAATIPPLLSEWTTTPWSAGWDAGLIRRIPCGGTLVAYRVRGESGRWAPVVERLVRDGTLLLAEAHA